MNWIRCTSVSFSIGRWEQYGQGAGSLLCLSFPADSSRQAADFAAAQIRARDEFRWVSGGLFQEFFGPPLEDHERKKLMGVIGATGKMLGNFPLDRRPPE